MLIALFRPHQRERKAWIALLRGSGYTVQIVHDPERVAEETAIIVIDRFVARWKDFVRMVGALDIPIVLLGSSGAEEADDWKSLHVVGTIHPEDSTDGIFERILAEQVEIPAPTFPHDRTSLKLPERKHNPDEINLISEEARIFPRTALSQQNGGKTLSQRQAARDHIPVPSAQGTESFVLAERLPGSNPVSVQENEEAIAKRPSIDHSSIKEPDPKDKEPIQASGPIQIPLVREETIDPPPPIRSVRQSANMPAIAAVYAAKGGTGKTTFLLHLAARLAKEGQRVCVLDMDLVFGTVATLLNIEPRKSIVDLLRRIDDPKASRACLLLTESDFFVVAAPSQPGRFQMDAVHLPALLRFLKEETDLVLIDTPIAFDSLTRQVLEASDQLFLLTTDEPASLLNLERIRPLLASLHPSPESWLVWNRLTAPAPRELWKERLPWPSVLELPEESTVNSAVRRGEWIPVSPSSPYRVQIGRLVDQWLGKETESSGLGKKRFFNRWPFK